LLPDFLTPSEHERCLAALRQECDWVVHRIRLFGAVHDVPRLSAWHGEPWAAYSYSGIHLNPTPWTPILAELRQRAEAVCRHRFDGVFCNWYRHGRDYMAWHSDDEPSLGPSPLIASLSLGAPRRFLLRRKDDHRCRREIELGHGSLLVMAGPTQRYWQHSIAKTARPVGERFNLTYRWLGGGPEE
jgi:alkylated DNA repair dioxygenase AlkB